MNAKKFLAILLTLVMLIGMMPVTALAADKTSGKCGDNATWSYDTASGTLTISGTGPAHLPDTRQLSRATTAGSSA